jgi:UDP-N-acetylglucosamine/UDP-N-acetylgalactosamine diphosphorylase
MPVVCAALKIRGVLDDMTTKGIETIFLCSVDNLLVRVADPLFIGYFLSQVCRPPECASCVVCRRC